MIRIALDIDDTIVDWINPYLKEFNIKEEFNNLKQIKISKDVYKLRKNKQFWENLPLLEKPNFIPHLYCTKRINSKQYTKRNLVNLNLPIKPIYQLYTHSRSKSEILKGVCDLLIDDSYKNVLQCIEDDFPALLINRPHNQHIDTPYRIYNLNYQEIITKYNEIWTTKKQNMKLRDSRRNK